MANKNLTSAKNAKNDEFYTQYADIEKEVNAYIEYDRAVFRGKTIYCNCDDPFESNFFKFFVNKFEEFGLKKLLGDEQVTNKRGIFEYVLGGETDTKLLAVRVFDERTKKAVYRTQTDAATAKGESNCPLCSLGNDAHKSKIWRLDEMDADHITAWSRGGATDIANCQMLCKTHNRAKGNK